MEGEETSVLQSFQDNQKKKKKSPLKTNQILTKIRVVSFIEEQLVANSLHNNVPGVNGTCAAHQGGQDGVGGKHITLSLSQL